ncbi:hypothetical protein EGW08_011226 [Elysia chlorotica]|uniref:Protein kinase domain-containing protein n=1 Tax=Elysia chlorotica TaxID=188477 RepID=A0A3S1BHS2_ELYCH|nr:hypothetical protein EGW08_011226 [Elysia chlorotica]
MKKGGAANQKSDMFPLLTQNLFSNMFPERHGICKTEKADHLLNLVDVFRFWSRSKACGFGKTYVVTWSNDDGTANCELMILKIRHKDNKLAINSIRNEVQCLRKAQGLPFFRNILATFQTNVGFCMLTDFREKTTLHGLVETVGRLCEEHIRFYSAEVTCALSFLHDLGVIHRSLTASNIALDFEGHVVLVDLGFVSFLPTTDLTLFDGPPYDFLAPEMVKGELYSKSVDWWALGVLIFFLMHNEMPFASLTVVDTLFKIIEHPPAVVGQDGKHSLGDLCRSLLTKDPVHRLGDGITDAEKIKSHPFFHDLDWELVEARGAEPPPIPEGTPFPYESMNHGEIQTIVMSMGHGQEDTKHARPPSASTPAHPSRSVKSAHPRPVQWQDSAVQMWDDDHFESSKTRCAVLDRRKHLEESSRSPAARINPSKINSERLVEIELLKRELRISRKFSVADIPVSANDSVERFSGSRSTLQYPVRGRSSYFTQTNNNSIFKSSFCERYSTQEVSPGFPVMSTSEPILSLPERIDEKSTWTAIAKQDMVCLSEPLLSHQILGKEDQVILQDPLIESPKMTRRELKDLLQAYLYKTEETGYAKNGDNPNSVSVDKFTKPKQSKVVLSIDGAERSDDVEGNVTSHQADISDDFAATAIASAENVKINIDTGNILRKFEQRQRPRDSLIAVRKMPQTGNIQETSKTFVGSKSVNNCAGIGICSNKGNKKEATLGKMDITCSDTLKSTSGEHCQLLGFSYGMEPLNGRRGAPLAYRELGTDIQSQVDTAVGEQRIRTSKGSFRTKLKNSISRLKNLINFFPRRNTNAKQKSTDPARGCLHYKRRTHVEDIHSGADSAFEAQTTQYADEHSTDENKLKHPCDIIGEILIPTAFLDLFVSKTVPKTSMCLKSRALQSEERYRQVCNWTKKEQKEMMSKYMSLFDPSISMPYGSQNEHGVPHVTVTHREETTFPASPHTSPLTAHMYYKPIWRTIGPDAQEAPRIMLLESKTDSNGDQFHSARILREPTKIFYKWKTMISKYTSKDKEDPNTGDVDQTMPCVSHARPYHFRGNLTYKGCQDNATPPISDIPTFKTFGAVKKSTMVKKSQANPICTFGFLKSKSISENIHGSSAQKFADCVTLSKDYQTDILCSSTPNTVRKYSTSLNEVKHVVVENHYKVNAFSPNTLYDGSTGHVQNVFPTKDTHGRFENTMPTNVCTVLETEPSNEINDEEIMEREPPTKYKNDASCLPPPILIEQHLMDSANRLDSVESSNYSKENILSEKQFNQSVEANESVELTIPKTPVQACSTLSAQTVSAASPSQISTTLSFSSSWPVSHDQKKCDFKQTPSSSLHPRGSKSCQSQVSNHVLHKTYSYSVGSTDNRSCKYPPDLSSMVLQSFENLWNLKSSAAQASLPTKSAQNVTPYAADDTVNKASHIDKELENSVGIEEPVVTREKNLSVDDDASKDAKGNKGNECNADEALEALRARSTRARMARERLMADADTISLWDTWQCPYYSQHFCGDGSGSDDLSNMSFSIQMQRARPSKEPEKAHHGHAVGTFTLEYTKPPVEGFVVLG